MIQLLAGEKGSGKTKVLLASANAAAETAKGNVIFLDKDDSHKFELKTNIRLVNVSEYSIADGKELAGFIAGLVAADYDLEEIFIDRFALLAGDGFEDTARFVDKLSDAKNIKVTASVSIAKDKLSDDIKEKVVG